MIYALLRRLAEMMVAAAAIVDVLADLICHHDKISLLCPQLLQHNLGSKLQGALHGGSSSSAAPMPTCPTDYFNFLNQKNWDGLRTLFDQNIVVHGCKLDGSDIRGADEVLNMERNFFSAFPDGK